MNNNRSKNKKILTVVGVVIVLIIIAIIIGGGSSKPKNTNNSANTATKSTTYSAVLWNPANNDNTSMTLPACGWDCGKGWDTEAQASADSTSTTAEQPAVVAASSSKLQVYINVKNTGSAAGTPSCTVKASNEASNFESGNYYGVKIVDVPMLNGKPIQPGGSSSQNVTLTISNNGAQYVKAISVACK